MTQECFVIHYKGKPLWDYPRYAVDKNGMWALNPDVKDVPSFGGWAKGYRKEKSAKSAITGALNDLKEDDAYQVRRDMTIVKYTPEGS